MSILMRWLLLGTTIMTALYIQRKLKNSQIRIEDAVFWIIFSLALVCMALFPSVCIWFAKKLGFISAINFVFLVVIFLLVVRCFILSVNIASLEGKFETLVAELAIQKNAKLISHADNETTD